MAALRLHSPTISSALPLQRRRSRLRQACIICATTSASTTLQASLQPGRVANAPAWCSEAFFVVESTRTLIITSSSAFAELLHLPTSHRTGSPSFCAEMGGSASPHPPSQPLPMAVPAGGFDPPPNLPPARAAAALDHNNQHIAINLPMADLPHSVRMQDVAFSRIFFRLRAQNLTGLICGAIMLFVSRQSDSAIGVYVSTTAIAKVSRACRLCSRMSRLASQPAAFSSFAALSSPPRTTPLHKHIFVPNLHFFCTVTPMRSYARCGSSRCLCSNVSKRSIACCGCVAPNFTTICF
jgi:hypothetical protein